MIVLRGVGAGLNAATTLAGHDEVSVTVVDQRSTNHHRFQPRLEQAAAAGLSPVNLAVLIRGFYRRR